jgi:hypothetical protein
MIQVLTNTPDNVVAFRAIGEVTKEDYTAVIDPRVKEFVENRDHLNFLLLLDTPLKNFTFGAWFQDALLGLRNLTKWHRGAIVSDSEAVNKFTDAMGALLPGTFKGFKKAHLQEAIAWTAS